jgi:cytochrome c oxidase cbb3-type subunit III
VSDFTHWYIVVITVGTVLGIIWLIWWTRHLPVEHTDAENTTGHVWDGDLQERNNPLPRWWLGMFYLSIIFAAIYLMLFPGLGGYRGLLDWSAGDRYEQEQAAALERLQPLYDVYDQLSILTLSQHEQAMGTAKRLFINYCGQCHGSDAAGRPGFPNLTDDDWLYGGKAEAVIQSITQGRDGVMPAMGAALNPEAQSQVVAYIQSLSGQSHEANQAESGKRVFATYCAGCHGIDGKGNVLMGAPNLTDSIWLYGGDAVTLRTTILNGRAGKMPSHRALLDDTQIRLLAAYLLSFGGS